MPKAFQYPWMNGSPCLVSFFWISGWGAYYGCACQSCSAMLRRRTQVQAASCRLNRQHTIIRLISCGSMSLVSDIKLIRTDTTLDLSQKAEKGMLLQPSTSRYILASSFLIHTPSVWGNKVSHAALLCSSRYSFPLPHLPFRKRVK
jgi:hypothetical protein